MTPLLQAAMKKSTYNILLTLIKAGSNLDAKDRSGKGLKEIIENYLRGKLPTHKIDKLFKAMNKIKKAQRDKNILAQAVLSGYYNLVHDAIKNGENINQLVGNDNETPLFIAIKRQYWVIARLLIDNGANLNVSTKSGLTIKAILTKMAIPQEIIVVLFDNIDDKKISTLHGNYSPTLFSNQNTSSQTKNLGSDEIPKNNITADNLKETRKFISGNSK